MLRRLMLLSPLAALPIASACVPAAPPASTPQQTQCRPDGLDRFVGQKASEASGAEMLQASGARTLRWVAPGMAVTMDYRADRLTVSYDESMTITRVSCG